MKCHVVGEDGVTDLGPGGGDALADDITHVRQSQCWRSNPERIIHHSAGFRRDVKHVGDQTFQMLCDTALFQTCSFHFIFYFESYKSGSYDSFIQFKGVQTQTT